MLENQLMKWMFKLSTLPYKKNVEQNIFLSCFFLFHFIYLTQQLLLCIKNQLFMNKKDILE